MTTEEIIVAEYEKYRDACFPNGEVDPIQDLEMKQVFLAGALTSALMIGMTSNDLGKAIANECQKIITKKSESKS